MTDPTPDRATIGHLLQALEHLLSSVEAGAAMTQQLLNAERSGKRLAPSTVLYYEQQLLIFDQQRQHFRGLIATWWSVLERDRPN